MSGLSQGLLCRSLPATPLFAFIPISLPGILSDAHRQRGGCVCRIVMPVVRDIRLLGFIISTIVLGLLTKGYKISVQKIAFMTLKGIKVEVPERGVLAIWV